MKEGTMVEKHFKDMKELSDKLAAISAPITAEDLVATLLSSRPKGFSTLITALEALVDEGLSLKYVQQALVNEEQKMQERSQSQISSVTEKEDSVPVGDQSKRRPRSWKPISVKGHSSLSASRNTTQVPTF